MSDPRDLTENLTGATNSLQKMLGLVDKINTSFTNLSKTVNKTFNGNNGAFGKSGTGQSSGFTLGSNNPSFSNSGGGGGPVQQGMNALNTMNSMMPDVNATMSRMTQGYNTALMNGFSGARNNGARQNIETSTLAMMKNGLTGPGSDMQFANIMANSGIQFSNNYNSTYMQNAREVAGLAKYMNVDNSEAAQSMANLTSGPMSAQLMMNMGINTSDPMTGKMYSFRDIASQFESRVGSGRAKSTTDIMDSYHRGALGASLANSGFDSLQQQMILQDMMYKQQHGGKGIDFANAKQMDQLSKDNPMLSEYKMNYSDTRQMNKAEGAYKLGIDATVNGLTKLNEVAGNLAATFGAINSGASVWNGSKIGQGVNQVVSGVVNTVQGAISSFGEMFALAGGSSSTMGTAFSAPNVGSYSSSKSSGPSSGGPKAASVSPSSGTKKPTTGSQSQASNSTAKSGSVISLIRPVNGGSITAHFNSTGPYWSGQHGATDFGVAEGTVVRAAHDGVIHTFGPNVQKEIGYYAEIWSDDRSYHTLYAHLSANSFRFNDAEYVKQGDPIALSGSTGTNCHGAHLHFGLFVNGQKKDPEPYMTGGSPVASAASKSNADSSNGNSGSTAGNAKVTPAPVSGTGPSQISVTNGQISANGSTNYFSTGGSGSSNIFDGAQASKYYASQSVTSAHFSTSSSAVNPTSSLTGHSYGKSGGNNVTINLTIANASDSEARLFATKVKGYLEEDRLLSNMGAR